MCVGDTSGLLAKVSIFRQGDKLLFVAGHNVEAARLPFLLRLFDPFLRRRYEIPPYIPLGTQGRTAEQHEMRAMFGRDHDFVAQTEYQQKVAAELIAGNFHRSIEHIDRPLLRVSRDADVCPRAKPEVGVERVRLGYNR